MRPGGRPSGRADVPPRVVEWFYRVLLLLPPGGFRSAHGEEMQAFLRDAWADHASHGGVRGRTRLLCRLFADALRVALRVRLGGGPRGRASWRGDPDRGGDAEGSPRPELTGSRRGSMENWIQDVRWAARSLRRSPGFAAVVILTLALGLGANTAVFSVLDAVLLQPLPYDEPERLVRIYQGDVDEPDVFGGYLTLPAAVQFRDDTRTLEVAPFYNYRPQSADLTDGERPERVRVLPVGADYFSVLRAPLRTGRGFRRDEEREDARVVVIGESVALRYFGGAAAALGGELTVDGDRYGVVGVMAAGFTDPAEGAVDLWLPLALPAGAYEGWQYDNHYLSAIARLRPGATLEAAQRDLARVLRGQADIEPRAGDQTAQLLPLRADLVGTADTLVVVLMAAVGLLLLIACVNVAGLFLARGAARSAELAVRSALGSPRARLVRQLFAESMLLAGLGAVAGVLVALGASRALIALAPPEMLRLEVSTAEPRAFAFGLAAALLSGALFGTAPALRFTRPGLEQALRAEGRGGTAGKAETRARSVLVVAQFSLALVLLVGAGLLIRSFDRLRRVEMNMSAERVLAFDVNLPQSRYAAPADRARFHLEFQRRLSALPGIRAAGAVSWLPSAGEYHSWGTRRAVADGVPDPESPMASANQRVVEGAYFEALRIPLVRGRTFGPGDDVGAARVSVVNQALVARLYPDADPIGRYLRAGADYRMIVGVVENVPVSARGAVVPIVYHRHLQYAEDRNWELTQVVALEREDARFLDAARRELAAIDPALVLYQPRRLEDVIGAGRAQERFAMLLIGAFAAVAVLLAAVGIYGVLAYSVVRRRPELGIRMALGARASDVRSMVLRQGALLASIGIVLGGAGALVLTRWLRTLMFGISVTDPTVFAACAAALACIALLASALPAYMATRVDPVETMRRG